MTEIYFPNIQTKSLGSYLKGMGLFRIVVNQWDRSAHSYWDDTLGFVLAFRRSGFDLKEFLLHEYCPTPILNPWNNGSGFGDKEYSKVLEPIAQSCSERLQAYGTAIEVAKRVLDDTQSSNRTKEELVQSLRNELPEEALDWLDAMLLVTPHGLQYPPLAFAGGNEARFDFARNFTLRLQDVMDMQGRPTKQSEEWLIGCLMGTNPKLIPGSLGPFAPESTKTGLVNPWDVILIMEGLCAFAYPAPNRLLVKGGRDGFRARYTPVDPTTTIQDEGASELWMPIWDVPMSYFSVRDLLFAPNYLKDYWGNPKQSRTTLHMAQFAAAGPVNESVCSYERFALLEGRNGKMRMGIHMGEFPVRDRYKWYYRTELPMGGGEQEPIVELVGLAEAAEILGWDKRKLSVYIGRGALPEPTQRLASGPIWTRKQIEDYRDGLSK